MDGVDGVLSGELWRGKRGPGWFRTSPELETHES